MNQERPTAAMNGAREPPRLKLLRFEQYAGVDRNDPLRYYFRPIVGPLYRRRVELCLAECSGGRKVLEVGFGSGVTFLNLSELYDEIHGLDLNAPASEVAAVFKERGIETHLQNGSILKMPYAGDTFDTVLLISILEHLKPQELSAAFAEMKRVLRPGGQAVYGVPVERPLMVLAFRLLGHNIREHHFSTENDVRQAAATALKEVRVRTLSTALGRVYEVGHFIKEP